MLKAGQDNTKCLFWNEMSEDGKLAYQYSFNTTTRLSAGCSFHLFLSTNRHDSCPMALHVSSTTCITPLP